MKTTTEIDIIVVLFFERDGLFVLLHMFLSDSYLKLRGPVDLLQRGSGTGPFILLPDKSRNWSSVSNVKLSDIDPFKLLLERSRDVILVVFLVILLHFTPFHANFTGKHGSPIQFLFTPYWYLMAIIASKSLENVLEVLLGMVYISYALIIGGSTEVLVAARVML
jgi:hypothetical protein